MSPRAPQAAGWHSFLGVLFGRLQCEADSFLPISRSVRPERVRLPPAGRVLGRVRARQVLMSWQSQICCFLLMLQTGARQWQLTTQAATELSRLDSTRLYSAPKGSYRETLQECLAACETRSLKMCLCLGTSQAARTLRGDSRPRGGSSWMRHRPTHGRL